jgi:hypothetical protein
MKTLAVSRYQRLVPLFRHHSLAQSSSRHLHFQTRLFLLGMSLGAATAFQRSRSQIACLVLSSSFTKSGFFHSVFLMMMPASVHHGRTGQRNASLPARLIMNIGLSTISAFISAIIRGATFHPPAIPKVGLASSPFDMPFARLNGTQQRKMVSRRGCRRTATSLLLLCLNHWSSPTHP